MIKVIKESVEHLRYHKKFITVIEILVVIAILGILAAVTIPKF